MVEKGVVNIRGKEYQTVAKRVHEFRNELGYAIKDGWGIMTEVVECTDKGVIMSARIFNPDGAIVSMGTAEEQWSNTGINSTSALENCETSAVGRALAFAGLAKENLCSADELANALNAQGVQAEGFNPEAAPVAEMAVVNDVSPAPVHYDSPSDYPDIGVLRAKAIGLVGKGIRVMGQDEYDEWHDRVLRNMTDKDMLGAVDSPAALMNFIDAQEMRIEAEEGDD